jgi:hypothetical protein
VTTTVPVTTTLDPAPTTVIPTRKEGKQLRLNARPAVHAFGLTG